MANDAVHVRADEGLERGPRLPPQSWPERKPPIPGKLGEHFKADEVLARYLQGEQLADIAESMGVHSNTLNYHLLKEGIRERWRQAQVAVSLAEYHEARHVVRTAPDSLCLARAREAVRYCQFDLERLENRLFGQTSQINVKTEPLSDKDAGLLTSAAELLALFKARTERLVEPASSHDVGGTVAELPNAAALPAVVSHDTNST